MRNLGVCHRAGQQAGLWISDIRYNGVWCMNRMLSCVSEVDSAFLEVSLLDSLYDKVGDIDCLQLSE